MAGFWVCCVIQPDAAVNLLFLDVLIIIKLPLLAFGGEICSDFVFNFLAVVYSSDTPMIMPLLLFPFPSFFLPSPHLLLSPTT